MAKSLTKFYVQLSEKYGPQGWWPIDNRYHPNDYLYPKTERQKFEICAGAILTQNTSWINVERALRNLKKLNAIDAKKILSMDIKKLSETIRPAGYFNQKAKKLRIFARFYLKLRDRTPSRIELLDVWGIGPETADSILLYAYRQPMFVIDAYTKKIMNIQHKSYDEAKVYFERNLPKDYKLYQEFHALIVEHAKRKK